MQHCKLLSASLANLHRSCLPLVTWYSIYRCIHTQFLLTASRSQCNGHIRFHVDRSGDLPAYSPWWQHRIGNQTCSSGRTADRVNLLVAAL
ncbi:hypothetical protein CS542_07855 [Pedobacter sp. IW39]|nr:hypothetical protein CS542_07855 [Pedobacter sp. IW39]